MLPPRPKRQSLLVGLEMFVRGYDLRKAICSGVSSFGGIVCFAMVD